ncbi:MAG: spore maturation protein [Thermanaeromonas sp.]|uniref:spore maturation protein n=1 Tax=Thermanaeromonas sp. TaxID=2003697 RepID=UPI00243829A8|nr:spore maturation protein [Thermanaeromonas sp.]MCG0278227.1 spore maturation protein [Thermanaeromonas sp.]
MTGLILELSRWAIPFLLFFIPSLGFLRGVRVYEAFVAGAEDGFKVAVKIIPFLVGMLVAIGVFRASGAMDLLAHALDPVLRLAGIPGEVLPLAILRPLSGGGALGVAAELISEYGPDSFIGRLASVMQGSTDTTFYVLTVYFGSVGIRRYRYALALGLIADVSSLLAAVAICRIMFG